MGEYRANIGFFAFDVDLPAKRDRKEKNYPVETVSAIKKVYGPIDELLMQLPDCFIAGPEIAEAFESGIS